MLWWFPNVFVQLESVEASMKVGVNIQLLCVVAGFPPHHMIEDVTMMTHAQVRSEPIAFWFAQKV